MKQLSKISIASLMFALVITLAPSFVHGEETSTGSTDEK